MKASRVLMAEVLVLVVSGAAWADFALTGTEHLDVTSSHATGVLLDSSTVNVKPAGSITKAYVNDFAGLQVETGGYVQALDAQGGGTVAVSGGNIKYMETYGANTLDISGGRIEYLDIYGAGSLDISGGMIDRLCTHGIRATSIAGGNGNVKDMRTYDTSTVEILGGILDSIDAHDSSTVDIFGGSFGHLGAYDTTTVTFHGYDFRAIGGLSLDGDLVVGRGQLIGRWLDGTAWVTPVTRSDSGNTIRITADPPILPGDADRSGFVDDTDLAILLGNWTGPLGTGRTWETGDFEGDGGVSADDLSILLGNWTGAPPAGATIPEPATLSLLALGGLAVMRRRPSKVRRP